MEETQGKKTYLTIPNKGDYELQFLLQTVDYLRQLTWTYEKWTTTPALIDRSDRSSRQYIGQKFDPKYFDLVEDGWTHDHCEICLETISNKRGYGETDGYVAENSVWLCKQCFSLFIDPKDVQQTIRRLKTKEK